MSAKFNLSFFFSISSSSGIEQVVLGLHIIRGDNIAVIGQIDEGLDSRLDFHTIRGEPLGPVVH